MKKTKFSLRVLKWWLLPVASEMHHFMRLLLLPLIFCASLLCLSTSCVVLLPGDCTVQSSLDCSVSSNYTFEHIWSYLEWPKRLVCCTVADLIRERLLDWFFITMLAWTTIIFFVPFLISSLISFVGRVPNLRLEDCKFKFSFFLSFFTFKLQFLGLFIITKVNIA